MSARVARSHPEAMLLDLGTGAMEVDPGVRRGAARSRGARGARRQSRGELAGTVRILHCGRVYCGWYRVAGDLLTVYCGLASNTGLVPDPLPSPRPFAERLLRALIDAEHPGLNPE